MKKTGIAVIAITALLLLGQFLGNYGNYQIAAIPGQVIAAFDLSDLEFSSLMTAPMLPAIFFSIVLGVLADRFSISKVVGICLALSACGFLYRTIATDYSSMLIAMAVSGFGCTVINANLGKLAASLYPMEKMGTMVGVLTAAATVAMAVAYGTTAFIPSLEVAFWITAIAGLAIAAAWILLVRDRHFTAAAPGEGAEAAQPSVKESLSASLKSPNVWIAALALGCVLGGSMVISNFQVLALTSQQGFTESHAGGFATVLMIGAICGAVGIPIMARKLAGKTPALLLGAGLLAALCEIGLVALPEPGMYACSFLNGALRSGVIAIVFALPAMLPEIGPKYAGAAGGIVATVELLGAVVVPTYVIVPLCQGDVVAYFFAGALFVAVGSVAAFAAAKRSGAFLSMSK